MAEGHRAARPAGVRGPGPGAVAAGEDVAAWCVPVRATTTPASTATTATPATTHTHRGGRGQPPNSATSSDGTTQPRPHRNGGSRSIKQDRAGRRRLAIAQEREASGHPTLAGSTRR